MEEGNKGFVVNVVWAEVRQHGEIQVFTAVNPQPHMSLNTNLCCRTTQLVIYEIFREKKNQINREQL